MIQLESVRFGSQNRHITNFFPKIQRLGSTQISHDDQCLFNAFTGKNFTKKNTISTLNFALLHQNKNKIRMVQKIVIYILKCS